MTSLVQIGGALLLSALTLPVGIVRAAEASLQSDSASAALIARGGGRGGGGGGGGHRMGGGGGGGHRAQTGFKSAGSGLNSGSNRPSGGWSTKVGSASARPSMDRPSQRVGTRDSRPPGAQTLNRDGRDSGSRELNRDGKRDINRDLNRDVNRDVNRDINRDVRRDVNRNWNREVNIDHVNLYPGWARPGWGVARPWNTGWYGGWGTPAWGWWGARAAVWGIGALATAAIINDAVDDAIDDHVSYIVVPNSSYQLLYGTVSPSGSSAVSFDVSVDGSTYRLSADCNAGTLNGQEPSSSAEAELLNAACQVAYGKV